MLVTHTHFASHTCSQAPSGANPTSPWSSLAGLDTDDALAFGKPQRLAGVVSPVLACAAALQLQACLCVVVGDVGELASIVLQAEDSINLAFNGLSTVLAAAGVRTRKGEQTSSLQGLP
jgi:hypothetical protein